MDMFTDKHIYLENLLSIVFFVTFQALGIILISFYLR